MKYTYLNHSVVKDHYWSLHKAGCPQIQKTLNGTTTIKEFRGFRADSAETFEADNLTRALDHIIDEEMKELGYDHDAVYVCNCCKESEKVESGITQRHNGPESYFCTKCHREHGTIYRKFEAHKKFQKTNKLNLPDS